MIQKEKPPISRRSVVDDQGLEIWFDFPNPVKRGGTATSSHPFLKLSSKGTYYKSYNWHQLKYGSR